MYMTLPCENEAQIRNKIRYKMDPRIYFAVKSNEDYTKKY